MTIKLKFKQKQPKECREWLEKVSAELESWFRSPIVKDEMAAINRHMTNEMMAYGKASYLTGPDGIQFLNPDGTKGQFFEWPKGVL